MNINLRNAPVSPDDTTMIILPGKKPVEPQKKRDLALRCGVRCIKLRFKGQLTSTIGVSGFQPVKIMTQPRPGGGIDSVAVWAINEWTKEPVAERTMEFVPDEMDTGYAYLPDGPFNRVRLAYAEIAKNALWEIEDESVRKEILDLADEIKKSPEYRAECEEADRLATDVKVRVQERGIIAGEAQKSKIELTNKVLSEKIKELEQQELREKNLKRLAELQARVGKIEPTTETTTVLLKQTEAPVTPKKINAKEIRNRAKAEIYSENAELLDSVKAAHLAATGKNKGWGWSTEYRDKIEPLIENRIKEITEREYSTVGGAT